MSKSKSSHIPYWILIVGGLLPAALFCEQAHAQDCSMTLTNSVGDTISVAGQLQSTDSDELDEDEGLSVVSSGGELADSTTQYNTPVPFKPFTAKQANETINGFDGEDGDETCQIFASAGPPTLKFLIKEVILKAKPAIDNSGNALAIGALVCAFVPECRGAEKALAVAGGVLGAAGLSTAQLTQDPPDPNYKDIAVPMVTSDIGDEKESDQTPADLSEAFRIFSHNGKVIVSIDHAIIATTDRVSGARVAKDSHWERVQLGLLQDYKRKLGAAILEQVADSIALSKAIRAAKADHLIQPADAQNYITSIEQNGLPDSEVQLLTSLGLTTDDITLVEGSIILQDPNNFNANISSFLVSPTYIRGLKKLGNELINDE